MARLTVEDCMNNVSNRYDLVVLASKRARQIALGADPLVPEDGDKPTVIALREIANGLVTDENIEKLRPGAAREEADLGFLSQS
jgi:DNA-directed RNA polymerase subunit omega